MEGDIFKYHGHNLTLIQDCYASSDFTRHFEVVDEHGYTSLNPIGVFEAKAMDEEGNSYYIMWDIIDINAEESCDAVDWDDFYVRKL